MSFFENTYVGGVVGTAQAIDWVAAEEAVSELVALRARGGRLFILGLGGSAGNAGHMTNDVRKLADIEAYAPTDNVSELTARINDDGWGAAMIGWLRSSRLRADDAVFVLSVGGGDPERGVSTELVAAMDYAVEVGAPILGIVGRDGGHAARLGTAVVVVPPVDAGLVTPLAEAFQAVIWHGMVTHPRLAAASAHWESLESR
ncbi:MAG: sugar isomerase [Actinomycetota bacterium]|nr:sugar isomerase [Actinomycetota bacterium]MEC8647677.1 sugar isomerase [Actinomycetota bacterium]